MSETQKARLMNLVECDHADLLDISFALLKSVSETIDLNVWGLDGLCVFLEYLENRLVTPEVFDGLSLEDKEVQVWVVEQINAVQAQMLALTEGMIERMSGAHEEFETLLFERSEYLTEVVLTEVREGDISNHQELRFRLDWVYHSLFPDLRGKAAFDALLDQLRPLYGKYLHKFARKALGIMWGAYTDHADAVEDFFAAVGAKEQTEMACLVPLEDVVVVIGEMISELEDDTGVIGVVLYGSYLDGSVNPDSDVDVMYLTEGDEPADCAWWNEELSERLGIPVDNFYGYSSIDNELELTEDLWNPAHLFQGQFRVISPYASVKSHVEGLRPAPADGEE